MAKLYSNAKGFKVFNFEEGELNKFRKRKYVVCKNCKKRMTEGNYFCIDKGYFICNDCIKEYVKKAPRWTLSMSEEEIRYDKLKNKVL